MVQLSHPYMTTGKTIALTIWTFVSKVISLLLICCLGFWVPPPPPRPRNKHLLSSISWLQSRSAVILEPKKIKYITASTLPFLFAMKWWDQMPSLFPSLNTLLAKSLQSCPTLCNSIDGRPPGFTVHGIFQARVLEWVAISFSNAWKWKVKVKSLSRVRLFATAWTAAYQAPLPMEFSRQEYWSGVPLPSLH